jgi:S-DNA-T family DNA segregation ATPase FtsK/SpoIIIE
MKSNPVVSMMLSLAQRLWAWRPRNWKTAMSRELVIILVMGFSVLYLTALVGYHPSDPSPVTVVFPAEAPRNPAGIAGAWMMGWLVHLLGVGVTLLPVPFFVALAMLVRRREAAWRLSRGMGWLLLGLFVLVATQRLWPHVVYEGIPLSSGGVLGVGVSRVMERWFGAVGTWVVLAMMGMSGLVLAFQDAVFAPTLARVREWWGRRQGLVERAPIRLPEVLARRWGHLFHKQDVSEMPAEELATVETSSHSVEQDAVEASQEEAPLPVPTPSPARRIQGAILAPITRRQAYHRPPLTIFRRQEKSRAAHQHAADLDATGELLTRTLADFGVTGKIVGVEPGPVVTVFEYQPDAGVKQTRILSLIDDLALALKVDSIFIHPVKGKRALGIQVPNTRREIVYLGDVLGSEEFSRSESPLTFAMGKSLNGTPVCTDLMSMPHLLAAGATGSGKSVAINGLLCSVIMKASPDDVRMILVDPKMLELSVYEGIPHLLMPVITDPARASLALKWAAAEMDRRYQLMQYASVRNIAGFNEYWDKASEKKREDLRLNTGDPNVGRLPYIMLVIDELADLMLMAPKDVESSIQRLAQKARASGIHLVLATQRPSVDVITGVIKANLPCRVAFQVVSKHDSRTILDLGGADKLLGKGDMLFQKPGMARLERLQGALVGDEEVLNLVANLKATSQVRYDDNIIAWIDTELARQNVEKDGDDLMGAGDMNDDPKFEDAVQIASSYGAVSASFLQRHLKIGYNRAARMVEFMESKGMVAKADGAKPRKWLGGSA